MLSDLTVFSEFLYTGATEVLQQQLDLFNAATNGALALRTLRHVGDYADAVHFAKVPGGLVRRRNAYGSGALTAKHMSHLDETMVKVAAGTPPVELNPAQWSWIQRSPEEAASAMALQLSVDMMADMVNLGVGVLATAMSNQTAVTTDISARTGTVTGQNATPKNRISPQTLNEAVSKFGDQGSKIGVWLMHSGAMYQLFDGALANDTRLFQYGNVNVNQDGFGRRYVMSDVPALTASPGGVVKYYALGLTPDSLRIDQQDDFDDNMDKRNGNENISMTYQGEWSYSVGVRGFQWDKTGGGHSPTDAALLTSANWDRVVTSDKDLPGVVLISAAAGL